MMFITNVNYRNKRTVIENIRLLKKNMKNLNHALIPFGISKSIAYTIVFNFIYVSFIVVDLIFHSLCLTSSFHATTAAKQFHVWLK